MTQHDKAIELIEYIKFANEKTLNEATTRSRIIDTVIYDILAWPKNKVIHEESINEGYIDYTLKNDSNDNNIIIEAKKESVEFKIPHTSKENNLISFIKMNTLLTDSNIKKTVDQVRHYCLETCTKYAAITNGHTWIFFKVFDPKWKNLNAYVIKDLKYFSENFVDAYNSLSYQQIKSGLGFEKLLNKHADYLKKTYSIKSKINAFDAPVDLNEYASFITKPVKYYFGDFITDDKEFLENCYVDERLYENTKNTLSALLIDNVSPYLKNHGVIDYTRQKLTDKLTKKVSNFIDYNENNKHIVIIYGDRGCGKSTFIRKLINSDIPEVARNKLRVIYIDLLNYAAIENDFISLKNKIWSNVIKEIDVDNLRENYKAIQEILFPEEFKIIKEQLKTILPENSPEYGLKLEEKIKIHLADSEELSKRLALYLRKEKKYEIVLVVDNTDQYSAEVQDFCFQMVAEIYSSIKSLSIITIREERFFRSKNIGVLDAYETTQYHISSPHADKVFLQRLNYLIESLAEDSFFENLIANHELTDWHKENVKKEYFQKYFEIFKEDFRKKSNLFNFLTACAQKDMRKALDLFRKLVVSGYMNIKEIVHTQGNIYKLQIHQVLKPLMTPEKYFYDESISSVPNIFKLRSLENTSHFTSIRILQNLNSGINTYYKLSFLKSEYISKFDMEEDFINNITTLIEYKLIEANIRVDSYNPQIEEIKITPFGEYFINGLIHFFTYLDLISTDCDLFDEQTTNFISTSANEEYKLFCKGERGYRLIKRIEKTNIFIQYLIDQEIREKEIYNLNDKDLVMKNIIPKYNEDLKRLEVSSFKQNYKTEIELSAMKEYFKNLDGKF